MALVWRASTTDGSLSSRQTMGLPAGWIYDLYLDHAGRLWIASNRQGVSRIDDPTAEHPSFHQLHD